MALRNIAKNILPWMAKGAKGLVTGRNIAAGATGYGAYAGTKAGLGALFPKDYYYNPTPENLARRYPGMAQLSSYGANILAKTPGLEGYLEDTSTAPATPQDIFQMQAWGNRPSQAQTQADTALPPGSPPGSPPGITLPGLVVRRTREQDANGQWFEIGYDKDGKVVSYDYVSAPPPGPAQPPLPPLPYPQLGGGGQPGQTGQTGQPGVPKDQFGRSMIWNGKTWEFPPDWNKDPATFAAGYISPAEQRQMDFQKDQMELLRQQAADERAWREGNIAQQRKETEARLSANPRSWLEYAAFTGKAPVVQPWMVPLSSGQYGQNWQTGGAIPGWTPESMKEMPGLINPSAQYMARLGPDPRAQYYGYQQARTGQSPEQAAWGLRQTAPPGGYGGGLSMRR